jgi:hypothetical protein
MESYASYYGLVVTNYQIIIASAFYQLTIRFFGVLVVVILMMICGIIARRRHIERRKTGACKNLHKLVAAEYMCKLILSSIDTCCGCSV